MKSFFLIFHLFTGNNVLVLQIIKRSISVKSKLGTMKSCGFVSSCCYVIFDKVKHLSYTWGPNKQELDKRRLQVNVVNFEVKCKESLENAETS